METLFDASMLEDGAPGSRYGHPVDRWWNGVNCRFVVGLGATLTRRERR
jgi:hypothetical protein